MEHPDIDRRLQIPNRVHPVYTGVTLTDGRLREAFENNRCFLKRFDVDRMLYWFRVYAGRPAPGAPYGFHGGHFENNLHGQTAGMFLMAAGALLQGAEDAELRRMLNAVTEGIAQCRDRDGYLVPVPRDQFQGKEYPNYVRAWLTFGLLGAGYAGNPQAFGLAREMGDWFNHCDCLPYVKDLNLGFQGILANTELYHSPVGTEEDLAVAQRYYREDWWLEWLHNGEQRAIYQHPGNHPHGTLLTTLEAYLDIYRATGEAYLLECVQNALRMYRDKWQHVGGGIVMCEEDTYYPGCNYLGMNHNYNELCCSTFWVLLHQRMHLLFPDVEAHVNEMEKSVYNVLVAAQVEDRGLHYLAYLEGAKDLRYADIATCCAGTGSRLLALLPQFLYTHTEGHIYVNLYASSTARIGQTVLRCETAMPYGGKVTLHVEQAADACCLHLRIPSWCARGVTIHGVTGQPGSYVALERVKPGDVFTFELPFAYRVTRYTGAEEIPGKHRYAVEYGPLLLAAMGRGGVELAYDPKHPGDWLAAIGPNRFSLRGNAHQEFMAYMDIADHPFTVYPVVDMPQETTVS